VFSTGTISLSSLKKNRYILDHILWDVEPKQLMQPRCGKGNDAQGSGYPPSGYILYIETMEKQPGLFFMIQTASGYAETFAKINDVPDTLLAEAIQENRSKEYCKMYPINHKLKEWLKGILGVTG
jgi:hypothetical protein